MTPCSFGDFQQHFGQRWCPRFHDSLQIELLCFLDSGYRHFREQFQSVLQMEAPVFFEILIIAYCAVVA